MPPLSTRGIIDPVNSWGSDPCSGSYDLTIRSEQRAEGLADTLPSNVAMNAGQLGPYRLVEQIGKGSMGDVYRAVHVMLDRTVAIKVIRPELAQEPVHVACFIAEAHAVNMIRHPYVIDITDVVSDPGQPAWMVMDLLAGTDLRNLLARGALELGRALWIVRQLCDALTAIHFADIVHRDIKPENIFITERDGLDCITVLDFGIALTGGRCGISLAPAVGLVGTPQYMAPEQAAQARLDHRSDLYALGVVLFEAITGDPPFRHSNLPVLLEEIAHGVPGVPSQLVELPLAVRADLDRLVGSCLEKDPARRPQSAAEIAGYIDAIITRLKARHTPPSSRRRPRSPYTARTSWPQKTRDFERCVESRVPR